MSRRIECPKCGTMNKAGTVCECYGGSDQRLVRPFETVDLHRLVRQGWRAFECDECGHKWEWPSRDRFSPSGENCPKCGEWLFPCGNREDSTLPVDDSGNLKIAWNAVPNAELRGAGEGAESK